MVKRCSKIDFTVEKMHLIQSSLKFCALQNFTTYSIMKSISVFFERASKRCTAVKKSRFYFISPFVGPFFHAHEPFVFNGDTLFNMFMKQFLHPFFVMQCMQQAEKL